MKLQIITVAAAALMAAPMLHAQATATQTPTPQTAGARHQMRQRRPHGDMMKQLGLTADQQTRMKSIHSKYAAQMKAARAASKPDFDAVKAARTRHDTTAMRVARQKMRSDMAPTMKIRQQEMAESRAVLTADQQKKLDAQRATMKAKIGARGNRGWLRNGPAKPVAPVKPSPSAI
jgi:Spy/CpxP family protein refolding chaperone